MLVSTFNMEGRHTSELKTLDGIGVNPEAGGLYVCIAENNRTASNESIAVNVIGMPCMFSVIWYDALLVQLQAPSQSPWHI